MKLKKSISIILSCTAAANLAYSYVSQVSAKEAVDVNTATITETSTGNIVEDKDAKAEVKKSKNNKKIWKLKSKGDKKMWGLKSEKPKSIKKVWKLKLEKPKSIKKTWKLKSKGDKKILGRFKSDTAEKN